MSSVTYPVIRGITDKHKNRNGCPMPATWFIQTQYTDADLVRKLYVDTHEVATHTVHHPSLPSATEILGAREWLNKVRSATYWKERLARLLQEGLCLSLAFIMQGGCMLVPQRRRPFCL